VPVRRGSITTTFAAARADGVEASEQIGRGEQAALRSVRVGAHHDEIVGAVEVGDRERPHPAEQERRRHVLRPLVDCARRVEPLDARHRCERGDIARQREVVRGGIADVGGQGGLPMPLEHAAQQALHFCERLVPAHFAERLAVSDQRRAQTIGIVVDLAERGALGTDVALTPHIVLVRADLGDPVALDRDLESAHRLAQRAGLDVDSVARLAHRGSLLPLRVP
jgi:hypothetical protein